RWGCTRLLARAAAVVGYPGAQPGGDRFVGGGGALSVGVGSPGAAHATVRVERWYGGSGAAVGLRDLFVWQSGPRAGTGQGSCVAGGVVEVRGAALGSVAFGGVGLRSGECDAVLRGGARGAAHCPERVHVCDPVPDRGGDGPRGGAADHVPDRAGAVHPDVPVGLSSWPDDHTGATGFEALVLVCRIRADR